MRRTFYLFLSTHQTTFFNYVIGIFILIVLSRLANLHGVMRGMFPLQVIRYLRGSGVVERLNWEGELGRGGMQARDKAMETHVFVIIYKQSFFSADDQKWLKKNSKKKAHSVGSCNNINKTIKCLPRKQFNVLSIHFFRQKLLLPFTRASNCITC